MNRRQFLVVCSGGSAIGITGCSSQEREDTPEGTSNQTDTEPNDNQDQPPNTTSDQHLVLENKGANQHSVSVNVRTTDEKNILDRTAELAAGEQRRFALDVAEPGVYPVSVTVNGELTGTWSISFEESHIRDKSDIAVEITANKPDVYREGGGNEQEQPSEPRDDQQLVLVNRDDTLHSVQATVQTAEQADVLDRTVDLAADERQRFTLDVTEPGTYTVSVTVDGDEKETGSNQFR